jgi:hypothetical protein
VVAFVITGVILICATDLDAASLIIITFAITVAVRVIFGLIRKKKRKNDPGVIITKDYTITDIPNDIPDTESDDEFDDDDELEDDDELDDDESDDDYDDEEDETDLPEPPSIESSISGKRDTEKTRICTQCGSNKFMHKDGKVVCQYCGSDYTPDNVIDDDKDYSEETNGFTKSQRSAYLLAKELLKIGIYSRNEMIEHLETYSKYPPEDAEFAVEHLNADWYEQAYICGKTYLKYVPVSQERLVEYLKYKRFTDDQADYGAKKAFRDE